MNQPAASLNANGNEAGGSLRATEPAPGCRSDAAEGRFTYPSGSRPLEGYTIKRGLGQGGFGEVYFATSDGGKEVALKLIRRNYEVELRGIRQCLNLKHTNLLAIYDIRQDEKGDYWVVMEYVAGQSLDQAIAAHPQGMPPEQVLEWIHAIGAGVAYLHDHGIVHRDLKPGNIFCEDGVVKLGDYGLSKFISCSRRSGQTESIGTVHYMAPEVANGRYGKEIDVYALGVILYEMLTGEVPFDGESVGEILMKHLTAQPDFSRVPPLFRPVVAKALEKDPAKRYASVGEMLAQLPRPVASSIPLGAGAAGPFSAVATAGQQVQQEPVAQAVYHFFRKIHLAWKQANLDTPTKIILTMAGLFLLLSTAWGWLPLLIGLAGLYACYWVLRAVVLMFVAPGRQEYLFSVSNEPAVRVGTPERSPPGKNVAAAGQPVAEPHGAEEAHGAAPDRAKRVRLRSPAWARRPRAAEQLAAKSAEHRVAELLGSLLASAAVAAIMCLVMLILYSYRSGAMPPLEVSCWFAVMSIASAWTVLLPAKFWEGNQGDPMVRRFVMLVLGLVLGVVAFALAAVLRVHLPSNPEFVRSHGYRLPDAFYGPDGTPGWMAYMACFGTLFVLVRWWRQADPLRGVRLGLWAIILSMAVAWVVASVWLFPQPWLLMIACAASVAVQLSSPWVNPHHHTSQLDQGG